MDDLVTAEWLAAALGAPDLVVLEATKYLPTQGGDGRAAFVKAHIPGARYFDIDEIADVESPLPHMVPAPGRFARLVGALGIGNATRVVCYDQNSTMWATRAWWMLRLFGHNSVAVLDGGLPAWLAAGQPAQSGEPSPATPVPFIAQLRAERLRGLGDMQTTNALVLDARAPARFAGSAPEPRPGVTPGHIPGAVNLPYSDVLDADGRFRAAGAVGGRGC